MIGHKNKVYIQARSFNSFYHIAHRIINKFYSLSSFSRVWTESMALMINFRKIESNYMRALICR